MKIKKCARFLVVLADKDPNIWKISELAILGFFYFQKHLLAFCRYISIL
uniref:Uncharacterized protein n=1 Tax=Meloidogyne enterolobii TaxID=390850 RepID=A0A6V7WAU7_MELEN|nr:unnamed protein product [Meloidogyne enterolobii]